MAFPARPYAPPSVPAPSPLALIGALAARGTSASADITRELSVLERWPSEALLQHQLERARSLLAHATTHVPWYRERLRGRGAPRDWRGWRALPLLRRADVQLHRDALRAERVPVGHGFARTVQTSGSTGRPVIVDLDRVATVVGDAIGRREHAWHGRDPRLSAATIRAVTDGTGPYPEGKTLPRWSSHPESGVWHLLDVSTPARQQMEWLDRRRPAYLSTYANNAEELLRLGLELGWSPQGLREVATYAEVLPDGLAQRMRTAWGVPLVDSYSASEIGFITLQCPELGAAHVQSENVLVEVLDAAGNSCAPGETGRVVVTPLHGFVMPLVRYELGDWATVGRPCACGRGLPVLSRVLGRSRNLIVLPNGDRVWPRFGSNVLGEIPAVRRFRLWQPNERELVIELVTQRALTAAEEARVLATARAALGHALPMSIAYRDDLPRSANGKFEDCRSDVAEALHAQDTRAT